MICCNMRLKQLQHKQICIRVGKFVWTVIIIISPAVFFLMILNILHPLSELTSLSMSENDLMKRSNNIWFKIPLLPRVIIPSVQIVNTVRSFHYQRDKSLAFQNKSGFLQMQQSASGHFLENSINFDKVSSRQRGVQKDGFDNVNAAIRIANTVTKATTNDFNYQRLNRAHNFCFGKKPGSVMRIMVDKTKKIANCIIPKAGCTFWINIFRYINNETDGVVYQNPAQIPRWTTHYANKSREYSISQIEKAPLFLRQAFRFMFVRDPYKRLWASWIDKFLLPDYWFETGEMITLERNMGKFAQKCPINITFVDFLEFITDDYFIKYPEDLNEHWAPFHLLCDPCLFRPHFIGKMESFEEDVNFVLAKTNLSTINNTNLKSPRSKQTKGHQRAELNNEHSDTHKLMKEENTRDEHILHEMDLLVEYTFDGVWRSFLKQIKRCVSQDFVAQRLWLAFQLNGYIPQDCPLQLTNMTSTAWSHAIRNAYSKWDKDSTKRFKTQQEQKRNAMKAAYQKVPLDVMIKLQVIFNDDFKQFGYDSLPESLFKRNQ